MRLPYFPRTDNSEKGVVNILFFQNADNKKPTCGRDPLLSHPGELKRAGHAFGAVELHLSGRSARLLI